MNKTPSMIYKQDELCIAKFKILMQRHFNVNNSLGLFRCVIYEEVIVGEAKGSGDTNKDKREYPPPLLG